MLNSEQLKAVCHEFGAALIKAGPGSGKTAVITHHINYLISNNLSRPEEILVISFSRASAKEMKDRYHKLFQSDSDINFGTFHSVYYRFLRLYKSNIPDIIDDSKKEKFIINICDSKQDSDKYISLISLYKSSIYKNNTNCFDADFYKIYNSYNQYLNENHLMDYDDILIKCFDMLNGSDDIKKALKSKFKYILIDEFQDINEYQYEIIKMISDNNLYVVGDINQSIYGFRGSDIRIFEKFLLDFKNSSVYELITNYRSHKDIIEASFKMIYGKNNHHKGEYISINNDPGEHFFLTKCKTLNDEFVHIKNKILKRNKSDNLAILLRTNKDVNTYKRKISLITSDEEYVLLKVLKKIIYNYIDYALYKNSNALMYIINIPNRSIPRNILLKNSPDIISTNKDLLFHNEINKFLSQINILKRCKPVTFCLFLKNIIKIGNYINEIYPELEQDKINSIFNQITNEAGQYESLNHYYLKLNNEDFSIEKFDETNINIMTFHASKGLEFDEVIIPDVIEGVIPGRISIGNMNVDEEKRLLYVAMTRAKKRLEIITLSNDESSKYIPSRFLKDLL